ncbi:MAG: RHS domain-containing protein [Bacteroidales bacterium]|jgi:hypothetical protein|nr:RHS domain-containing protein [Bacteroidales bacterium]
MKINEVFLFVPVQLYYAHTDHLGSIVQLTDNNGNAVFNASYDAWGYQSVTTNTIGYSQGYTGHEHLPEFGLINMTRPEGEHGAHSGITPGRMYDPLVDRFKSWLLYTKSAGTHFPVRINTISIILITIWITAESKLINNQ